MPGRFEADAFKRYLEAIPQVSPIGKITIEGNIVKTINIDSEAAGKMTAMQLDVEDAPALFEFYFGGLSERARRLFIPYPLFHSPPSSSEELAQRIADWRNEDDWSAIILVKNRQIIGLGILKRFRTEQVTSAIVIRDDCMKMGLGYLLQMILIGQARLLNLKRFHVKVISDNIASVRLHEKCGFKKTRTLAWDGYEDLRDFLNQDNYEGKSSTADRHIIEMVIELDHD